MASVLVAADSFNGHGATLLYVAGFPSGRGDRIRICTGSRFADAVRSSGTDSIPLTETSDIDDQQDWNAICPGLSD